MEIIRADSVFRWNRFVDSLHRDVCDSVFGVSFLVLGTCMGDDILQAEERFTMGEWIHSPYSYTDAQRESVSQIVSQDKTADQFTQLCMSNY